MAHTNEFDVLVVGAGPAGLALAIAAATRGLKVRVVDAAKGGPIDKACGEGLLPDAVETLKRLGVRVRVARELVGIRFHDGDRVAEARFPAGVGLGVRRPELHRAMLECAAAYGIRVEWGTTFKSLDCLEARFVVGADGGQSRVREAAGLDWVLTHRRVGLRQHFRVKPWSDFVEVFWADGIQAYVTPVGDEEVGVAFLAAKRMPGISEAIAQFPELRERLAGADTASKAAGGLTVMRKLPNVTSGRIALVGDASGSVDAITGEGLNLCFRQAQSLAEAIGEGDLARYEENHQQILQTPRLMASALLWMNRSPMVRRGAIAGLAGFPGVFRGLLGVHVGA